MKDALQKIVFLAALSFLCFVWGVTATEFHVFPYRIIQKVETGYDAWTRMEDASLPHHKIDWAEAATSADPVRILSDSVPDDLILMTGGFYYRMDLCPTFGCMAMVMDRSGKVLHTWEFDPDALFRLQDQPQFTGRPSPVNLNVQAIDLDPDGNLIVTLQGRNVFPYQVGVAKFSWNGMLLWLKLDYSHHWPKVGPNGRIYVPIARIDRDQEMVAGTRQKIECKGGAIYQEGVQILAPDGTVLHRYWLDDLVRTSDMQGLAYSVRNDCDPYHVNGIDLLNAAAAARMPGSRAGDLVVSLRSSSALVIVDPETGELRRILKGPMVAQHSPNVMADGRIAVFDNLGGIDSKNGTRVVAIDPATGRGQTLFPTLKGQPGDDLLSDAQGAVALSPDGTRALVAETLGGRVFEFDVGTGAPLWEYQAISDLAPFLAKVGQASDEPRFAHMQTQGARYLSRADFARFGAAN